MGKDNADDEIIEDENCKITVEDDANNDKKINTSKYSESVKFEDSENPVLDEEIEYADFIEKANVDDNINDEKVVGDENVIEELDIRDETESNEEDDDLEAIRLRNISRNKSLMADLLSGKKDDDESNIMESIKTISENFDDETGGNEENVDEDDDLEASRLRNIARNKKIMEELMKDTPEFLKSMKDDAESIKSITEGSEDETGHNEENVDDNDDDLEAVRLRNIARNKKIMEDLMKDAPEFLKEEQKSQRKRHSKPRPSTPMPLERRSSARNRGEPVTYNEHELDKIYGDDDRIRHSRKRNYDEMRMGKENISFRWKVQMRINKRYSAVPELPVSEVTPEHLANISTRAYDKIYSKNGSSCHQCRQKTMDTKTYCRSGQCTGVRGQFCGPCLDGRYGEKVAEALQNPNWSCPPCRGICNCSICLSRQGFAPTGILRPYCIEKGYKSVKHYLEAVQKDIEGDSPKDELSGGSIRSKFAFDIDDFSEDVPDVFEGFK